MVQTDAFLCCTMLLLKPAPLLLPVTWYSQNFFSSVPCQTAKFSPGSKAFSSFFPLAHGTDGCFRLLYHAFSSASTASILGHMVQPELFASRTMFSTIRCGFRCGLLASYIRCSFLNSLARAWPFGNMCISDSATAPNLIRHTRYSMPPTAMAPTVARLPPTTWARPL